MLFSMTKRWGENFKEHMFRNATLSVFEFFTTTENKNYPGKGTDTKVSSSQCFLIVKYYDSLK